MATNTTASLASAVVRRFGAGGAIQPNMVGAAGEGWRLSGVRADWSLTGTFATAAAASNVNFLRMPGGTAVDYWDWTTGQCWNSMNAGDSGNNPPGVTTGQPSPGFKLTDWLDQCVAIGAEPFLEFNVCLIPDRLSATGSAYFVRGTVGDWTNATYQADVDILVADNIALLVKAISYMQAKGGAYASWTPKYIELGNEIYLSGPNNPGPATAFGGGTAGGNRYAYLAYTMANAIRTKAAWAAWAPMAVAGHCRIWACGTPSTTGRSYVNSNWQNALWAWNGAALATVVDGSTIHGEYWTSGVAPTSDANAYSIINAGVASALNNTYTPTATPVSGETTLPASKTVAYTEFNYPDTGTGYAGMWVVGLGMVAAHLTMIDDPAVEMICAQAFVGSSSANYSRVASSGGKFYLTPWGVAVALLCEASAGATVYQKINFTAGTMGSGALANGQGLLGGAFKTPNGQWSACIVNGDAAAYTVHFGTTTPFNGSLTGAQIATTYSDTTIALPASGSMGQGSALSVPGYSVTWIVGGTSSGGSPPTISNINPTSGTGSSSVTVTGTNFKVGGVNVVNNVYFGTATASNVQVATATSLTTNAPVGVPSTVVDVTVVTTQGTSTTTNSDQFTYTSPSLTPTISNLNPSSGTGSTSVTVTGTNFTSGGSSIVTSCHFGTVTSSAATSVTSTSFAVVAPSQAPATVDVTVTTSKGTSATSSNDQYVYPTSFAPTVTAVSPTSGSALGGDTLTVTGTNFQTGGPSIVTAVWFGGSTHTGSNIQVTSSTSFTVTTPFHVSGTVDVRAVTTYGTSQTTNADHFTFNNPPAPTVTTVSPPSGGIAGGDTVTVTGTNFKDGNGNIAITSAHFAAATGSNVQVSSTTQFTVISPASASTGSVDITATSAGGTSTTSSADQYTYTSATPGQLAVPVPSTVAAGDAILLFAAWGDTTKSMTGPAGYTGEPTLASTAHKQRYFYKIADGTETTATLSASGSTPIAAVAFVVSSVHAPDPHEGGAPTTSGKVNTSTTSIDAGTIHTSSDVACRAVWFGVTTAASGGTPPAITPPAGYTAYGTQTATSKNTGTNVAVLVADFRQPIPVGTSPPDVAGVAASACVNGAMNVLLRPH